MSIFLYSFIQLAQAENESPFFSEGELRINATQRPGFQIDFEGRALDSGLTFDSRLRTTTGIQLENWSILAGGDLFHGNFAGSPWDIGENEHRYHPESIGVLDADDFLLRSLQVQGGTQKIFVQSGVTTSHWGLGLVANDGNHRQSFGRQDYGDRVFRTSVVYRPLKNIAIMTGGDFVLEDDIGGWKDGYESYQGLASVQYFFSKESKIGLLYVYRDQTEMETQKDLKGSFIDLYATTTKSFGDYTLHVAWEGAYLHGETNRISNRNNPDGLLVRSFGTIGEIELAYLEMGSLKLRSGFASGDSDSSDGVYSTFTFDRDSNAGSLLFDVHQAAREIAEYNLLTDPEHAGQPPDGVDSLITEGAIRQAMFVQPILQYNVNDWSDVALGSVLAWSTVPVKSSFISYRNGGAAVNHLGNPTEGYHLGTEVNWAVGVSKSLAVGCTTRFSVEGAHLLPSTNLSVDETLSLVRGQLSLTW